MNTIVKNDKGVQIDPKLGKTLADYMLSLPKGQIGEWCGIKVSGSGDIPAFLTAERKEIPAPPENEIPTPKATRRTVKDVEADYQAKLASLTEQVEMLVALVGRPASPANTDVKSAPSNMPAKSFSVTTQGAWTWLKMDGKPEQPVLEAIRIWRKELQETRGIWSQFHGKNAKVASHRDTYSFTSRIESEVATFLKGLGYTQI